MATEQTFFCPYLGKTVTDEITPEHVFSDSLGCPNNYCLPVSKRANSALSNTFEQKFLTSSRVLYLCNGLQIPRRNTYRERSGKRIVPDWKTRFTARLPGSSQTHQLIRPATGEDFVQTTNAKIKDSAPVRHPAIPVGLTVQESGTIRGQAEELQRLKEAIEQKNPGRVIWGTVETLPIQEIDFDWGDDPDVIHKFLSKVQFAVALKEFLTFAGDSGADRFRSLLFNTSTALPVIVLDDPDRAFLRVLLPDLRQVEHGVAFYHLPNGHLLSVVAMFGGNPFYQACLVSQNASRYLPFGNALEVRCHSQERKVAHRRESRNPVAVQQLVNVAQGRNDFWVPRMAFL